MIKIGFIGLDTSHPESFYEILSNIKGVKVSGVYDDNSIRSSEYVQEFCASRDIKNCSSLEELKSRVDGVMVLAVNWDNHLQLAKPFLEVGKPVFIDKPIAGNIKDLREFEKFARQAPHLIMAGSGWRFNDAVKGSGVVSRTRAKGSSQKRLPTPFIYTESRMPRYFYGIHAAELMVGLLGSDIKTVQALEWNDDETDSQGSLISVQGKNGAGGLIRIVATQDYWRGAAYSTDGKCQKITFTGTQIHESVCHTFIDSIKNKTTVDSPEIIGLSVKIMLAAKQSAKNNGTPVELTDIDESISFDGNEFNKQYKKHGTVAPKENK